MSVILVLNLEKRVATIPSAKNSPYSSYTILGQDWRCGMWHQSIESLMLKLKSCWDEISQQTIRASCNQVADRLRRVVKAKGGYIEK